MTETEAKYEVQERPGIGGLLQIKEVDFQDDRLVFYGELTDDLIERIDMGLGKFHKGHQWYYGDFWAKLRDTGREWTDHIPCDSLGRPIISVSRANTWLKVRDKFLPESRVYKNLWFSHYEAVRSVDDVGAHDILGAADGAKISVEELEEVVRGMKGKPKTKKPKLVQCLSCGNWKADIEDKPCLDCENKVLYGRIEVMQGIFMGIRDFDVPDVGVCFRFAVDESIRALEEV